MGMFTSLSVSHACKHTCTHTVPLPSRCKLGTRTRTHIRTNACTHAHTQCSYLRTANMVHALARTYAQTHAHTHTHNALTFAPQTWYMHSHAHKHKRTHTRSHTVLLPSRRKHGNPPPLASPLSVTPSPACGWHTRLPPVGVTCLGVGGRPSV